MAFLIGMSDSIKGRKFEIESGRTTIGRNSNNHIVLDDGTVSSQHCYISHRGGRYILHDLNSTNGTKLNYELVGEAELKGKQIVQVGSIELMFDDDSANTSLATTALDSKAVVDDTAAVNKPQTFSSVSPFGSSRRNDKSIWLLAIFATGLLALIGFVLFVHKLLS